MIYLFGVILLVGLSALSWADLKTFRLPDPLNLVLAIVGLIQSLILLDQVWWSVAGLLVGYVGLVVFEKSFKALRSKDGIGRGDAKLLAVGGAWCGLTGLPFIILIASLTGLIFVFSTKFRREDEAGWIPFGPFLSLSILTVWLWIQYGIIA